MRGIGGLLTMLLALGLYGAAPALPAAAADFLSEPKAHAELRTAPGWVMMAFSFPLDPSTAKILVLNSAGENVTTGELAVEYTNVRAQLQSDLPKDTYTVHYRVSKQDGEPVGGTFQFAYGKGNWAPGGESTWKGSDKEPPVMKNPDPNATTALPEDSPTPTPTPTPSTATATSTPTAGPSPTATSSAAPAPDNSGALLWVILVGAVAVVAAAVGAWLYGRRPRPHD